MNWIIKLLARALRPILAVECASKAALECRIADLSHMIAANARAIRAENEARFAGDAVIDAANIKSGAVGGAVIKGDDQLGAPIETLTRGEGLYSRALGSDWRTHCEDVARANADGQSTLKPGYIGAAVFPRAEKAETRTLKLVIDTSEADAALTRIRGQIEAALRRAKKIGGAA